ncbi:hypothetical protein OKW22_000092 [Bacilli bacterium PM5-3]|nr:hypothetical protein [Bacilli bacterium PM5-3]MDH6603372.1 hypothetical protein [Bacilli bacterium PM5-9]
MKKIGLIVLMGLLISGCSNYALSQSSLKANTTNNHSIVFSNEKNIQKLCTKSNLDNFVVEYDEMMVFDEFNLGKFETFKYNKETKNKYSVLNDYSAKCQYQVSYLDMTSPNNFVNITKLNLKKDEKVDFNKLYKEGLFKEFIDTKDNTINANVIKKYLKGYKSEDYEKLNIVAENDGEYQLIIKPIFRIYHFADENLINDYDIAGVSGVYFQIKKVD